MNLKMLWKKLKNRLFIKYIQTRARIPKVFDVFVNILIVGIWALGVMLVLDLFLGVGIGLLEYIQSLAVYLVIEQMRPWILKLNLYRQ